VQLLRIDRRMKDFEFFLVIDNSQRKVSEKFEDLVLFPIETIVQDSRCLSGNLDGVAVFTDQRTSWESHKLGGDLSWRGAINDPKLQRLWKTLCAFVLDDTQGWCNGFRLVDKTVDGSSMLKIEVWVDNASDSKRRKLIDLVQLPASEFQFGFSSHREKSARACLVQHSETRSER
jgi:hypothetical protein